jgi:hypothetical protein
MIALLLSAALAAEPTPATASLLLLPSEPGEAPVALRALADGRAVLVLAGRRGLVRYEGRADAWRRVAEVPSPTPDEVAIDAGGTVWTRRGDALSRWDAAGLVDAPLAGCAACRPVHLRVDGRVPIEEEPTWTAPLADGLSVDVTAPAAPAAPAGLASAPRLHRIADTWALAVDGADVPLDLDAGEGVAATATADGWLALVGTRLHVGRGGDQREGVIDGVAPEAGEVAVRADPTGRPLLLGWDARVLRVSAVDLDAAPIRWVDGWLPAGPGLSWPRPATSHDPLPVASRVQVTLPAGLAIADVAVTSTHLVVAGTAITVEGARAAIALVARTSP